MEKIPIHDFSRDDSSSIPFDHLPLTQKSDYDTSVPHRHNYYEIFIFDRGGGEHDIDFHTFPIHDRSVHFVSPGQVHNVRRDKHSSGQVILFSRDFYAMNLKSPATLNELPFLNNNSYQPVLNLNEKEYKILKRLAIQMEDEKESEDSLKEDLIRSFLSAFLFYCKRFFKVPDKHTWKENSLAFRFKQKIEQNFTEYHSVSEYAKMLNVTEKQLNSQVKSQVGIKPSEMIYGRIILEAKRLVLYSDHSFQEIAYFLNYSDPSHFTKFFKSKTGFTPGEFREKGKMYQNK